MNKLKIEFIFILNHFVSFILILICKICSENTASRISSVSNCSTIMKPTYTIAAIAMFAVIMGMSAIAPAMAYHNEDTRSNATTSQCHFDEVYQTELVEGIEVLILVDGEPVLDEDLSSWIVLHTSSKGADKGHQKHGDLRVTTDAEALACVVNQDGTIETIVIPDPPVA